MVVTPCVILSLWLWAKANDSLQMNRIPGKKSDKTSLPWLDYKSPWYLSYQQTLLALMSGVLETPMRQEPDGNFQPTTSKEFRLSIQQLSRNGILLATIGLDLEVDPPQSSFRWDHRPWAKALVAVFWETTNQRIPLDHSLIPNLLHPWDNICCFKHFASG